VHAQILDAQVQQLRAAERLHQVFTDLAVAGASQDEIVRQASRLAGVPVILADLGHRVLACAAAGEEAGVLLDGFAARSRGVAIAGRTGYDAGAGWLVSRVGGSDGEWARVIFLTGEMPDAGTEVLAERTATTLALARSVADARREESPVRLAHSTLLAALAGPGYADLDEVRARIIALGVPLAGRGLLAVVTSAGGSAALAAACQDQGLAAVTGTLASGRAGALLALPSGTDHEEVLADLADRLRSEAGADSLLPIGVGPRADSLDQVRNAFREASDAAGAAEFLGHRRPVVRLAAVRLVDLGLAGLLFQLRDDPRLQAFAEHSIGPLLAHDAAAGTELTRVLATYLASGGNKALTAQRAGLARPTLYERLRQIEQVLGVSLEAAEVRVNLHASLLALGHSAITDTPRLRPLSGWTTPALRIFEICRDPSCGCRSLALALSRARRFRWPSPGALCRVRNPTCVFRAAGGPPTAATTSTPSPSTKAAAARAYATADRCADATIRPSSNPPGTSVNPSREPSPGSPQAVASTSASRTNTPRLPAAARSG
jgi:PucR family transcriptional regulator, purine catabolism regulatory protein